MPAQQPRESAAQWLHRSGTGTNSPRLRRTQFLARSGAHLWRVALYGQRLAQKKAGELPELTTTLLEPAPSDPTATALELDELWSFVLKKSRKRWIWIALCRQTRQVVAYLIGDRSEQSCRQLWERIPEPYRQGHCYTDFWAAYQNVIPAAQHTPCGKESGLTAHVERWNNTLRQRLARFVRKTLSFSKSNRMHEICLRLFLHRYNLSRRPT